MTAILEQSQHAQQEAVVREAAADYLATLGLSRMLAHYTDNPQQLSRQMFSMYVEQPSVGRTINQFAEQVLADADVRPTARNKTVDKTVQAIWEGRSMSQRLPALFKMFLLSGEHWCFTPKTREGYQFRFLTPWQVTRVKGRDAVTWQEADYEEPGDETTKAETLTLLPKNTAFYAHDALFSNLRGTPPFASLYFATLRHKRFLDIREKVNRLSSLVTGSIRFATMDDAGSALGWTRNSKGDYSPKPVRIPESGSIAVLIGEKAAFNLMTPEVKGGDAEPDGNSFKGEQTEATRLPEFFNGDGSNVSVATAKVQYPIAARAFSALRDAFTEALTQDFRLLLRRMADAGLIADSWRAVTPDGKVVVETPESLELDWSWPEIVTLDAEAHFDVLTALFDKALITDDVLLQALGYDPAAVKPSAQADDNPGDEVESVLSVSLEQVRAAMRGVLSESLRQAA